MSQPPVIVQPKECHTATLIFLHGLGDSGHGWASTIGEIVPSYCKVICPTAPINPVTLNGGYQMTSWFDLITLDINGREDEKGIREAGASIHKMIDEEISKTNIPSNRILIGGFSQGGGLSLHSALRYEKPLAGVLAFSCWLPIHKEYPDAAAASNKEINILQCHGDSDAIVHVDFGRRSHEILKRFNPNVVFKEYPGMSHSSCSEELRDAKEFIKKILPAL